MDELLTFPVGNNPIENLSEENVQANMISNYGFFRYCEIKNLTICVNHYANLTFEYCKIKNLTIITNKHTKSSDINLYIKDNCKNFESISSERNIRYRSIEGEFESLNIKGEILTLRSSYDSLNQNRSIVEKVNYLSVFEVKDSYVKLFKVPERSQVSYSFSEANEFNLDCKEESIGSRITFYSSLKDQIKINGFFDKKGLEFNGNFLLDQIFPKECHIKISNNQNKLPLHFADRIYAIECCTHSDYNNFQNLEHLKIERKNNIDIDKKLSSLDIIKTKGKVKIKSENIFITQSEISLSIEECKILTIDIESLNLLKELKGSFPLNVKIYAPVTTSEKYCSNPILKEFCEHFNIPYIEKNKLSQSI